jgi:uncharacterized protein (DUF433 family)
MKPKIAVVSRADILGGMPCVEGTRVPAATILDELNHGATSLDVYRAYPYLPVGAIEAVRSWAAAEGRPCSAS